MLRVLYLAFLQKIRKLVKEKIRNIVSFYLTKFILKKEIEVWGIETEEAKITPGQVTIYQNYSIHGIHCHPAGLYLEAAALVGIEAE